MSQVEYRDCVLDDGSHCRVKIVYSSRLQQFLRALHLSMDAQTTWTTIRYFCPKELLNHTTIDHEMEHVRQWKRLGRIRFLWQYYRELIRVGYDKSRFENEARRVAGERER